MRIAMLTSWFYPFPSGSANRFYEIGKRLSRRHEVHVYTTSVDGPKEENLEGIHVHRYCRISSSQSLERGVTELNLVFSYHTLRRIVHDIRKMKFDIIDCNMTSKTLPLVSFIASRIGKMHFIQTWHEVWHTYNLDHYSPFLAPVAMIAEYMIPWLAKYCIASSNTTGERLVKLLGVQARRVVVIDNGVDLNAFERLSVKKRRARIVYAGRLERHKRVDVLLRVFKGLRTTFPESELFIIGDGSQRKRLVKLSSDLGLENVFFLGVIPRFELLRMIKSSTVLVLPSILEGQGCVLLEAMAAGTPPVAVLSPGSGVMDVVKHGFNGLLVGPSVEEMEKAIGELLISEVLYNSIRDNGLKFVKNYDWSTIATRISDFYKYVIRKG